MPSNGSDIDFGQNVLADENPAPAHLGAYSSFGMPLGPNPVHGDFGTAPYPSYTGLFEQQNPMTFPPSNAFPDPYPIKQSTNISVGQLAKEREDLLLAQLMPSHSDIKRNKKKREKNFDDSVYEGEKPQDAVRKMDFLFKKTLAKRLNDAGLNGEVFVKETWTKMYEAIEEDIKRDAIVCLNADRASLQQGGANKALLKVPDATCSKYVCLLPSNFAGLLLSFANG